jgi:hypothetical protein
VTAILLAPAERPSGTADQRKEIAARLASLRSHPDMTDGHPGVDFVTLAELLAMRTPPVDTRVFASGRALLIRRFSRIGVTTLLPPERVWVGTASMNHREFGGFHHTGQGYRHLHMASAVTVYGNLADDQQPDPQLAALDLLRSYARDCLDYATTRRYRLWKNGDGFGLGRVQHGINFRRSDGRVYSAPDPAGSFSTHNAETVMAGAIDREARYIAGRTASHLSLPTPSDVLRRTVLREATGRVNDRDLQWLDDRRPGDGRDEASFLTNAAEHVRAVVKPYDGFLHEIGTKDPPSLHRVITGAMLTGDLSELSQLLDSLTGHPRAFAALFRQESYR